MKKLLFSIFLIMMMIGGTASYAVNAPVLADGMTPVKWDSSSGNWVETNTTDADWYNYEQVPSTSSTIAGNGTGKWANAVTADGSMWVWIPRYTYKIVSGYHKSGNSFSNDTAGTNEIAIKWSNGTTDDNSSSYLSHPAFTLNGEELTGFWVAKVEATDSSSFLLGKNILVAIWPTAYDKVKSIQSGHLIRNSEWGAVAYLTNAIGRIPFGELDNGVAGELNGYDWNTEAGVKGSTTHNVYGVYGMNGGANEWVAGAVSASGNIPNVEFYTSAYDSSNKGDAVYETSDKSGNTWDGGTYTVPGSNLAFTRGADSIFSFNGCKMDKEMGYRAVISIPVTTYTVVFNPNYSGATATNSQSFVAGTAQNLATNAFTRDGYIFKEWNTKADGTGTSYTDGASYTATADITLYAQWTVFTQPNAPVLDEGLTPVNWNGTSWETTTEANWDYNYNSVAEATHSTVAGNGDGKWANAQTADGSLYVWIPRYSYKITSGEHAANQKSWNSLTAAGTAKIEVKFSNGTTDDTSNSYIKHPAFTFGTDELEGIWVAKYEASQGNTTSETSVPTSSTSVAKSIPGVASWRSITVSDMFDYAYNTYRNADSHLMKNVEWGAVAYLTNAIGRIPYINNSSSYITGNAGGSQDAAKASGTTNAWNTANGVKASTTHNVYGIYDMSGGAYEYVAAYYTGGNNSYISSLTNAADKYVDRYSTAYSASKKGDAVYETSSSSSSGGGSYSETSWDRDYSYAPNFNTSVFLRGGHYNSNSNAGVFFFNNAGGTASSNDGFRVVLTGVQPVAPTTYTITYNL